MVAMVTVQVCHQNGKDAAAGRGGGVGSQFRLQCEEGPSIVASLLTLSRFPRSSV